LVSAGPSAGPLTRGRKCEREDQGEVGDRALNRNFEGTYR